MKTNTVIALLAVLLSARAHAVYAETVNCMPIAYIPQDITKPGMYCLMQDLTSFGAEGGIQIHASPVVIDLNGHSLVYGLAPAPPARGVYSHADRVTVRNGTLRGFGNGVNHAGDDGLFEDLLIVDTLDNGIRVDGARNVVRRCRISNTGATPNVSSRAGIQGIGSGNRIIDNDVMDTSVALPNYIAWGIAVKGSPRSWRATASPAS
jgi:hypothetical protein